MRTSSQRARSRPASSRSWSSRPAASSAGRRSRAARAAASSRRPDKLFAAARAAGRLDELDCLCQRHALRAAIAAGVRDPCVLFLNIEPDTTGFLPLDLRDLYSRARAQMTVCVEITERALTRRPAALLAHVADMRAMGVAVALDDVGTDAETLAMMSLLEPEVIKLDLALVQGSPDAEIAEVVHAVAAQAERTGARVLVEGVETEEHARTGDALGATLAQGWLYGKPRDRDRPSRASERARRPHRPPRRPARHSRRSRSPPRADRAARPASAPLLLAMTQHLEDQAKALGPHRRARRRLRPARAAPDRRAARALRRRSAASSPSARSSATACRAIRLRASTAARSARATPRTASGPSPSSRRTSPPRSSRTRAASRAPTARRSTTTCSRTTASARSPSPRRMTARVA